MKPGVPDATAHHPRPQSPVCSNALPRWLDVVVTKDSLISLALPPLLVRPSGEVVEPRPRGHSNGPRATVFLLVLQSKAVDTSPLQWRATLSSCGWKRPDAPGKYYRLQWSL